MKSFSRFFSSFPEQEPFHSRHHLNNQANNLLLRWHTRKLKVEDNEKTQWKMISALKKREKSSKIFGRTCDYRQRQRNRLHPPFTSFPLSQSALLTAIEARTLPSEIYAILLDATIKTFFPFFVPDFLPNIQLCNFCCYNLPIVTGRAASCEQQNNCFFVVKKFLWS